MKTTILYIALIGIFFNLNSPLFSQWNQMSVFGTNALDVPGMGKAEDLQTIKDRKMIIMLQELDADLVAKLKKKDDPNKLNSYKNAVKTLNDNIKTAADSLWGFHNEFLYKTYTELMDMDKEKKTAYAVMYFVRYKTEMVNGQENVSTDYNIVYDGALIAGMVITDKMESDVKHYSVLKINALEDLKKLPAFQVPMAHLSPNISDIAFGLYYAMEYFSMKLQNISDKQLRDSLDSNSKQIADLNLLISEDDVANRSFDSGLKSEYPFKYTIVKQAELENHILIKSAGYAFLNYNCGKVCVIKTENGEPLYIPKLYDWLGYKSLSKMVKDINKEIEGTD